MPGKYEQLNREELVRLLEARDRRERFGLVWEANEIEREAALNNDFVALDLDEKLSCGAAAWRNLIIEGDNFDALRHSRIAFSGRVRCIYIDPLILSKQAAQWSVVRYDEAKSRAVLDRPFRVADLAGY